MPIKNFFKISLSVALVLLFVLFFYQEFNRHWDAVRSYHLAINWIYLLLGMLMMIANYLCTTMSWHLGVNSFDHHKKLGYAESFALLNISQLGKYMPGKLWSYLVQIYWLASKGVPKTTALYLNVITTLLPVLVSFLAGCLLLMMLPSWHHLRNELVAFMVFLLLLNLLIFNKKILEVFLKIFSRISGRKTFFQQLPATRIMLMEMIYIAGACFWALAGCFIALGIGFDLDNLKTFFISAAMLLGDVIGVLILIAPGGLGVREGTMYFILQGTGLIQFALIFPMVIRLMGIITDLIVGTISLLMISRNKNISFKKV